MSDILDVFLDGTIKQELAAKVLENIDLDAIAKVLAKDLTKSLSSIGKDFGNERMGDDLYDQLAEEISYDPVIKFLNGEIKKMFIQPKK